ncbi:hypothetical protein AB835_14650 [Candidatus Endobugula sertula]|uniref:Uncharacterized protein n=1 Tax=Candidatus Endobugula sertula TaxID=62101 RepID=A0A1D2QLB5_9GAMM|nr:hypothetical protein AB835_14650 [Candidatus Endobugula sertula]
MQEPLSCQSQCPKTLTLKHRIAIEQSNRTAEIEKQILIVYISDHFDEANPHSYWTSHQGEKFLLTTKNTFSKSIQLALGSWLAPLGEKNSEIRTILYWENGEKRVERGLVLYQECNRTVFKTLRGAIKSVPNFKKSRDNCAGNNT